MPELEPELHTAPGAVAGRGLAAPAAGGRPEVPPYRARAVHTDGQWHLTVESLNEHPDRGEVDSVVVTLPSARPEGGRPSSEIDGELRECGFERHGEWERDGDGWSTPCVQSDSRAAPAAPPRPLPHAEP